MKNEFVKREEKILEFWKRNKTFKKSIQQRARARDFVFYEGPPTANAKPGIHHILNRAYKDIICRYKTMQGFRVLRKAGWDTHGLPVELEIEKKLGLKNKKEIERYGIDKFNKLCQQSVWDYKKDWEKLTERIGFWLDLENPYITSDPSYMESVFNIIKQISDKGLLYQDYKVIPYCPRCGTGLSSHEVAQGYKKIKEPAIYVKFEISIPSFFKKKRARNPKTYLLVWTTTPWTLPGNVAIAVNPKITYILAEKDKECFIIAKAKKEILGDKFKALKEIKGKELIGLDYEPLFDISKEKTSNIYKILAADFVTTDEGTGLVHIAPAFGQEDMELIKVQNAKLKEDDKFPILLTVDEQGKFKKQVKQWAGMFVKKADQLIIKHLQKTGFLFAEEQYEHDYPFCWRCNTPLLYYAKKSWFIKTTAIKDKLIANNKEINWIPGHIKEGRFGEWLNGLKDWTLSRERYWGTPLPIWQCKKCDNLEIIGSKKDLLKQKFSSNQYYILRHGESLRNIKGKEFISCWPEKTPCLLTLKGKKQIQETAKKLKNKKGDETLSHLGPFANARVGDETLSHLGPFANARVGDELCSSSRCADASVIDLIFSSDLLRTRQTAEIVADKLGLKVEYSSQLREMDLGVFNGKTLKEFRKNFNLKDLFWKRPSGGENWSDCKKRMNDFIKKLEQKYKDQNILIISHGDPLWLLEGVMKGWTDKNLWDFKKNCKNDIKTGEARRLEFKNLPYNEKMELDFHRPFIDGVQFLCSKCGKLMKRVPEVIDCWFDSGAMPFAQNHWPFAQKNKKDNYLPPRLLPADYISEAIDQTRGWFYTLLAISTLLGFGSPYKNVISSGHILDGKGEKMSKSKGNVIEPWQIIEKYGSDALRWYFYTINQPGDGKLFSEKELGQSLKKFIMIFWNSFLFYQTYAITLPKSSSKNVQKSNILDQWIISRLNELIWQVTEKLNQYDITSATRAIENFVVNDFSQWYIRRSRRRFQKPQTKKELKEAVTTFKEALLALSKLTAPFAPFLSEEIYRSLTGFRVSNTRALAKSKKTSFSFPPSPSCDGSEGEDEALASSPSVHLEDWPKVNKKLIDEELNQKMEKVREIVALALAERAKAGIKVRQPLASLKIKEKIDEELLELIKEEINVKKITFGKKLKLDTKITAELREEGMIREVIRQIQGMRKRADLKPKDKILIQYFGTSELNKILEKNKKLILTETKARDFVLEEKLNIGNEVKIDNQNLWLSIKKT